MQQVDAEILKELKTFNRNVQWLKQQSLLNKPADKWGSYQDAAQILVRSREWYKNARLGYINSREHFVAPRLVKGIDWRMTGNEVEYRMDSIVNLKNAIIS